MLGGGAAALGLALLTPFGRSAHAGEASAAALSRNDGVEGLRAMHDYSVENEAIGVFINLRANSDITGAQLGDAIIDFFGRHEPPIAADYRVNQSRGNQTEVTFYVGGNPYTYGANDLQPSQLATVTDRFRGYQSGVQTLSMK